MRIAVIGAGAVGGTLAALLARAGHEVEVTARGENLDGDPRATGCGSTAAGASTRRRSTPARDCCTERPELRHPGDQGPGCRGRPARQRAPRSTGVPLARRRRTVSAACGSRTERCPASPLLGGLALFAASYLSPGHVTVTGAQSR